MTTPTKKKNAPAKRAVKRVAANTPVARTRPRTRSRPADTYRLRLFVAGATARSSQAVLRVHELCAAEMKGGGKLEVIDIYQQPALARAHQIVATPTLIIEFPLPVRRFIGNLSNTTGLFAQLAVNIKSKIPI